MNKRQQEILDELEHIAPTLLTLRQHRPMRVPDGYFGQNTEQLVAHVKALQQIKATADHQPLRTPDSYFSSFATNLIDRIKSEENLDVPTGHIVEHDHAARQGTGPITASGSWPVSRAMATAIAAMLTGAIILLALLLKPPMPSPGSISSIETIPTEALEIYVEGNIQAFDEQSFTPFMTEDDQFPFSEEEMTTEQLEEFLNEDIDLTTLEEML